MSERKLTKLELSKLDKLPTRRLLARLKRFQPCEESLDLSDRASDHGTKPGFIEFKDSPEWKTEYDYLKKLLKNRDHVSKAGQH